MNRWACGKGGSGGGITPQTEEAGGFGGGEAELESGIRWRRDDRLPRGVEVGHGLGGFELPVGAGRVPAEDQVHAGAGELEFRGVGDRGALGEEFEVEAEIAAGGVGLMDFDGDEVAARAEGVAVQGEVGPGLFRVVRDIGEGELGWGDGATGQAEAEHFDAVEIDDGAIVPLKASDEVGDGVEVGEVERVPEPGGDELA